MISPPLRRATDLLDPGAGIRRWCAIAFVALTLAGLLATLVSEWRGLRAGVWLCKPLASAGFVAAGIAAGALETTYGRAVLAGLVSGAAGDVLLIARSKRAFLSGLLAFLLGHLAYAAAFVHRGLELAWTGAALALLVGAGLIVLRWLLPHVEPRMRAPVVAYVAVISAMVAFAAGTHAAVPCPLLLAGTLAFYLSDLAVARNRFVAPGLPNRLWGLPLYYGGQLLLAASVAR